MSTTVYLAPAPLNVTQFIPGGNVPAAGGKLFCYQAGTSTKQNMFTDNTGVPTWTNPLILDSGGNQGGEVWIPAGLPAKFVLAPSNDTDPPASPYWSRDNISGINDPSSFQTEWVPSGLSATFVNASTFTFSGADQTGVFTTGRRLKTVNTAGTLYSTVTSSAFLTSTTTIGINSDSTGIDSGISSVNYGILNAQNQSIPAFLQTGAGAVNRTIQNKDRDIVSVKDFGAKGDGVTDDTAAIMAGSAASVAAGGWLWFPRGTYIQGSVLAFTSAHNNLKWMGCGDNGAVLKKHFNGTGMTVTGCSGFEIHDMHYYGDQANWTGKGIVFSGTCNYPKMPEVILEGFQSTFLEFPSNAGYDFTCVGAKFYLDRINAQSALTMIALTSDDNAASHRHFVDCGIDGDIDMSGALATIICGSRFRNLITTNTTSVMQVSGNSWALTGGTATANGANMTITGNRVGGAMTLGAGSSGSYVGNHPTAGALTNNTAAGSWTVIHHDGGALFDYIAQHKLDIQDSVANLIQSVRCSFVGDADLSFTTGTVGARVFYQSPLTTTRAVTLTTTAALNGATVRVTRQAASTGASTLTVGSKTLAAGQWVEYVFDSSAWQLSAFGSL